MANLLKSVCFLLLNLLALPLVIAQDFVSESYVEGGINQFSKADFNGDGKQDLLGLHSTSEGATELQIYMNVSDTEIKFEAVIIAEVYSLNGTPAIGDIDNDGDLDIAVSVTDEKEILIFRNSSGYSFQEDSTNLTGASKLEFIDLEGDGDIDLIGYVFDKETIITYINDGSGVLTEGTTTEHANDISSVDYGDLDDDGDIDFALSVDKFSGETVAIYLNDSLNNFTKLTSFDVNALNSAVQVKMVDFNKDGKMDVLGLNDKKLIAFMQNDIFGFIAQELISPNNAGDLSTFDVADFDGDGDVDIVLGDLTEELHWYKNQALLFTQMKISEMKPINSLLTDDFDGDGDIDFVASNEDFRAFRNVIGEMVSVSLIPESEMVIFPNPAGEFFEVSSVNVGIQNLKMFNLEGKLLRSETFTNSLSVSLEGITPGVYTVHVYDVNTRALSIKKLTKI